MKRQRPPPLRLEHLKPPRMARRKVIGLFAWQRVCVLIAICRSPRGLARSDLMRELGAHDHTITLAIEGLKHRGLIFPSCIGAHGRRWSAVKEAETVSAAR